MDKSQFCMRPEKKSAKTQITNRRNAPRTGKPPAQKTAGPADAKERARNPAAGKGRFAARPARLCAGRHVLRGPQSPRPRPRMSCTTTSPMCTGACSVTLSSRRIASKVLPLGMSLLVLTEARRMVPPLTRTVEVMTRVGFVSSFFAVPPRRAGSRCPSRQSPFPHPPSGGSPSGIRYRSAPSLRFPPLPPKR